MNRPGIEHLLTDQKLRLEWAFPGLIKVRSSSELTRRLQKQNIFQCIPERGCVFSRETHYNRGRVATNHRAV